MAHFTIRRFVTKALGIDDPQESFRKDVHGLLQCCEQSKVRTNILQTAGGFVQATMDLSGCSSGVDTRLEDFNEVAMESERLIRKHILKSSFRNAVKRACDFFCIGVDVYAEDDSCSTHAELVGVYDCSKEKFVRWTGKTYPLAHQANSLMYCRDLGSHFLNMNGTSVMVLGCHDLNIFSPRSRASSNSGSYKSDTMQKMDQLVRKHKPEVVLHHPHFTDTPNIWRIAWVGVCNHIPSCHTYSSGIHFADIGNVPPRGDLKKVLASTARGNVEDYIQSV